MFQFLKLQPEAFGLDISDLSIKVAQLKRKGRSFTLASFADVPLEKGSIEKGEVKKEENLVQALEKIKTSTKGKKISSPYAIVSLPEERAFLEVIQLPAMEVKDLDQAVRFEAENYIPYSMDTVYVDYSLQVSPEKSSHMDVLIASLPRQIVDSYLQALQKAGFRPLAFEIESFAIARALVKGGSSPFPLLLIDIGSTRTSFSVFAGQGLRFTSSIPVSSYQFTEAISKVCGVNHEAAERLKKEYGLSQRADPQGEKVFDAIVPPLVDLVEQIKKYLGYYESHSQHEHQSGKYAKIQRVLLCGGGALLRGLPEFLAKELRVDVALGNPWTNVFSGGFEEIPPIPFQESLKYTTALGLALRGVAALENV